MTSDLPLFQGAHQCLMFAYSFSHNQHAVAAAAERAIAMHGRERYRELEARVVSRGLSGVDGAAQAGMIKAMVGALPRLHQRTIEARFEVLDETAAADALRFLTFAARHYVAGGLAVEHAQVLVQRHFGAEGVRFVRLAEQWGVPERTLRRWWHDVRHWLQQTERSAMARVEVQLERRGLCEAMG